MIDCRCPSRIGFCFNVLSEDGRKGALYELLYADDLVLMAETMEELEAQFIRWKAAFEGKGLKISLDKIKVMESGGGSRAVVLPKIDPCGMRSQKEVSDPLVKGKLMTMIK